MSNINIENPKEEAQRIRDETAEEDAHKEYLERLKKQTFQDFLAEKHAKEYHGLDDDMSDDFNNWLTDLQIDEVIEYADEYANQFKNL